MNELQNYKLFSSENPLFSFTFLYPGDWQLREIENEVFILGPRNKENTYSLAVTVRVSPVKEPDGQYVSVEERLAAYLSYSRHSSSFKEISRSKGYLSDTEAIEIETKHTMPLPLNTVAAKVTPILERRIFLLKDSYFYELIFRGVQEDYYHHLNVFKNIVRTFDLGDEPSQQIYQPLVMAEPAHMLRESSPKYDETKP